MLGIPLTKPCAKFEVFSSNFGDRPITKNCLGHVTEATPIFGENLFVRPLGIPHTKPHTKFEVSSSSSFGAIDTTMVDMTLNDL